MNSGPILVLTVDDHALLRKGIVGLVNAESDMKVVAEASTGVEATKQFKQHRPDITLMDLQLPDMSGIEAMIAIRQEFPEATDNRSHDLCRRRTSGACAESRRPRLPVEGGRK